MAESESVPWLQRPAQQAVADSTGGITVTVQSAAWSTVAPHLSPEVAAMLAPPVVVTSLPLEAPGSVPGERRRAEMMRYRMNMPSALSGKHRRTRAT